MRSRSRRAASGGLWLLVAVCGFAAGRAHADPSPAPWIASEEMLVEVRAGRLTQRTVLARRVRGEVLLPCGELFDLLEMHADQDSTGRLVVSGGRGWQRIVIDPAGPDGPDAWTGERPINPDDLRVEWSGTELYVGTRALGRLLSTPIQVDLEDLAVTLENVDHLPVGRRIARERAREAWLERQGIRAPEVVLGAEPAIVRGAALTWGASAPLQQEPAGSSGDYRLGLGAGLVGGSLDLEYASEGWDADAGGQWTGSWIKAWPQDRRLRQARLGTIVGTGPHARLLRGAAVSNAPYQRMAYFGETSIVGHVPAGWDVEVWQGGQPVGFARADEHGAFDAAVPVEYGTNVVEIRAYGERGEEVWLSRALQIDSERLPSGVFEYQASWGECESGPCDTQGNLDLRWGVREALTVRAGADWFTRDEPTLFHPYTELIGAWRRSWLARMEGVADAFGALEIGYQPTPDLRAGVIHTAYEMDVKDPVLTPRDVRSRTQLNLFWRPDGSRPSRFLDASAGRTDALAWRRLRGRVGYHDRLGRVRWTADWQELHTAGDFPDRQSILGLTASATLSGGWHALFGRLHARGFFAVDVRSGALDRRGISVGRSLGRLGRIELSAEWSPEESKPLLGLNMSTEGMGFRSATDATRSPGGRYFGRTEAEGALVWNEAARRVEATPIITPDRGGISGSAFLDANDNGVRDPGEEPLAGVRVQADDRVVRTDRDGRYAIWDLPAFEPTDVTVDLTSAENPLLTSSFTRASVPVRPNGYRKVDVPLTMGVEVSGRILERNEDGSTKGLGGVPVILRHVVTGRELTATTFHDGEFYLVSVPSGDYEVTIPRRYLERAPVRLEHPERRYLLSATRDGSSSIDVTLVPEGRR